MFYREARKLYNILILEVQKVKKEIEKEMEMNEHLTSLSFRIENDISIISRTVSNYNEKLVAIEIQLMNLTKVNEQTQYDYNTIFVVRSIHYTC